MDPCCPQCTAARIAPPQSLDFDGITQKPLAADGRPLNRRTLQPE